MEKETEPKKKGLQPAELIECPFCGNPGTEKIIYKPFLNGWVGCKNCMVYLNWRNHPSDRDRAIKTWNTRPIEEDLHSRLLKAMLG